MGTATRLAVKKAPLWTLLLCSIATVVFFIPALGAVAIYDRDLIADGEWWRLVTGNFVHLSVQHFAYDVTALFVAGTVIEIQGDRFVKWVFCVAGVVIGLLLFVAAPSLKFYGGLSGIVTAALVYLCLSGLREAGRAWRWLFGAMLALVAVKIAIEFDLGVSFLTLVEPQAFVPVPLSHFAGACSAVLVFGWKFRRSVTIRP